MLSTADVDRRALCDRGRLAIATTSIDLHIWRVSPARRWVILAVGIARAVGVRGATVAYQTHAHAKIPFRTHLRRMRHCSYTVQSLEL